MVADAAKLSRAVERRVQEQRRRPYTLLGHCRLLFTVASDAGKCVESANCTYCPQVKFGQGSKAIDITVLEMHKDPAVKALRDEHGADLVQMVGYWGDPRGVGFG